MSSVLGTPKGESGDFEDEVSAWVSQPSDSDRAMISAFAATRAAQELHDISSGFGVSVRFILQLAGMRSVDDLKFNIAKKATDVVSQEHAKGSLSDRVVNTVQHLMMPIRNLVEKHHHSPTSNIP